MPSSIVAPASSEIVNTVITNNATTMEAGTHRLLAQGLDRMVGDYFFPTDMFQQSVDEWVGIPNIYAQEHVNLDAYDADPEAELARVNGRIAGGIQGSEVKIPGGPRLELGLDFGGDQEVEELYQQGKLTSSTAFRCNTLGISVVSPPRPHHNLLFKRDLVNLPKDPSVVFLNKQETESVSEEVTITNAGKTVSTANAGKLKSIFNDLVALIKGMTGEDPTAPADAQTNKAEETPAVIEVAQTKEAQADPGSAQETDMEKAEYDTQIANKQTEIANKDTEIAGLKVEITNKAEKITALESELTEFKNKAEDAKFQTFLNKIKPALRDTTEQKTELRNRWDNDQTGLLLEADTMFMNKNAATKATGDENVPITNKSGANGAGTFDPITKTWSA